MMVAEISMPEFEAGLEVTRTALLPVGSVEEHGRHLPLGTDTFQVWETARRAALRVPVFLCPPLHYGHCRSTRDHPGTLSLSPGTLRSVIFDLGASLFRHGIRGLIIASGHAGELHMSALEEAGERLLEEHPEVHVAVVCEYRWAQEAGKQGLVETEDDGHAGEIETSRMQSMAPHLVRGTSPEEYPHFAKPFLARDKRLHWPGGVWGNPGKASPEKGERLIACSVERMAELIREMDARVANRRGGGQP